MARITKSPALKPSRTRVAKASTSERPATGTEEAVKTTTGEASTPTGKLGVLVGLLRRDAGATLADMTAATGWQAHSVRGALAGSLKKKLGLPVTSEKVDGARVYRIAA